MEGVFTTNNWPTESLCAAAQERKKVEQQATLPFVLLAHAEPGVMCNPSATTLQSVRVVSVLKESRLCNLDALWS